MMKIDDCYYVANFTPAELRAMADALEECGAVSITIDGIAIDIIDSNE